MEDTADTEAAMAVMEADMVATEEAMAAMEAVMAGKYLFVDVKPQMITRICITTILSDQKPNWFNVILKSRRFFINKVF